VPSIQISNISNADILTADAGPGSGFSKYFQGDVAGFLASVELARKRDGGEDSMENLQGLCHGCHSRKTRGGG
jgi:5-methylcytosine-specific restriction endonuclease McrA